MVKCLKLPMGWASRRVYAGPYMDKPDDMLGVKLAEEIDRAYCWNLPIADFSIPLNKTLTDDIVVEVLTMLAENQEPVYVGCKGGFGRTGVFLSLLFKTMGVPHPIQHVRGNYTQRAVENKLQYEYVQTYVVPLTPWDLLLLKGRAVLHGLSPSS